MKDYLPHGDADLLLWLSNFINKIKAHGTQLGLSQADIAEVETQGEVLRQSVQDAHTKKEESTRAVTYKNEMRSAFLSLTRREVNRMKAHKGYSGSLGQELGIIGTTIILDLNTYKPALVVEIIGGMVHIKFQKKGVDGVNIYYRLKGEAAWRFLARDTRSPYIHQIKLNNPSQPEHLEYRAYGVVNDAEVGQASDVVEVIFGE